MRIDARIRPTLDRAIHLNVNVSYHAQYTAVSLLLPYALQQVVSNLHAGPTLSQRGSPDGSRGVYGVLNLRAGQTLSQRYRVKLVG